MSAEMFRGATKEEAKKEAKKFFCHLKSRGFDFEIFTMSYNPEMGEMLVIWDLAVVKPSHQRS